VEVYKILKPLNLEKEELLKEHIKKFFRLWSRNQWKRERLAPSFHLDDFNVDPRSWCRFPILNGGFENELKLL
jgi:NAD+ synthase (glutamine-hydrolysing)